MRLEQFRNKKICEQIISKIFDITFEKKISIMEVCGGHTHSIHKYRLQDMLPSNIKLLSGPGCPVCVTPISYIDLAINLSMSKDVILCTFGDLMRVPGKNDSLFQARANGADVRIVYSPIEALSFANENIDKEIVFLGIGFETTIPAIAIAIIKAYETGMKNFSVLLSAKQIPPVLDTLLSSADIKINGFIAPGHVSAIIGAKAYQTLCEMYRVPMVVTGFEPFDILNSVYEIILQISENRYESANTYNRVVSWEGNLKAQKIIREVFTPIDDIFRGIGKIKSGGFSIRSKYIDFDAYEKFKLKREDSEEQSACICGEILSGKKEPFNCVLFAKICTPHSPIGACMVSSEGSCNAFYVYRTL